jgi:hypothetical protein
MIRTDRSSIRQSWLRRAVVIGVVTVVSGVAFSSQASASPIALCVNRSTEVVRQPRNGKCRPKLERRLLLGATGPAGVAGPAGPVGPAGTFATAQSIVSIATPGYTLSLADAGKMLVSTVNTVITVPTDATVAFPIGTRIDVGRLTNYVFVQGATGVTVNGSTTIVGFDSENYQHGLLVKTAANTWVLLRFFVGT